MVRAAVGGAARSLVAAYASPVRAPSQFPLFPFGAFVLAGTVAGAMLGRQDPRVRRRRALAWGAGLLACWARCSAGRSAGRVDFWDRSPAYVLLRLGGLLLLLRRRRERARRATAALRPLALLGHETFHVFVLHLYLLYGWIVWAPHRSRSSAIGSASQARSLALAAMPPVLYAAASAWHALKLRAPREATCCSPSRPPRSSTSC